MDSSTDAVDHNAVYARLSRSLLNGHTVRCGTGLYHTSGELPATILSAVAPTVHYEDIAAFRDNGYGDCKR